jgi:hypothetical protein
MVSGVRFQVSGIGGPKYCWDVDLLLVLLVIVLDLFGNGLHKLYFSNTRMRTRNNLTGISGINPQAYWNVGVLE